MSVLTCVEGWSRVASSIAVALALCGCAGVRLQQIARQDPARGPGYVQLESGGGAVRVYRGGRLLDARRGMPLQVGDEIETDANSAAVIRDLEHGDVVLADSTRVRVGSLEVLFGRVFATVRGLFTASSENVVAGVEGTSFVFEVSRDRSVRVAVLDGTVTCRSRSGGWPPIQLRPREALRWDRGAPRVGPASERELEAIRLWAQQVSAAPRAGYCCDNGQVYPSLSNQCRGDFRATVEDARQACAVLQSGWCCEGGRVTQTARGRCPRGQFYSNPADAERACAPPPTPEPMVWCCADGKVGHVRRDQCGGQAFADQEGAANACRPVIQRIPRRELQRLPPPETPQIR